MLITHDTRCALDTVVDLVNTAPEDDTTPDGLPDVAALQVFVREHQVSEVGTLNEGDLAAVRRIRARFAAVFAASDARAAAGLINELIAAAGTTPR
ncbi:ABATE domain-containing protein, partial [Streptomyces sp. NPDC004976]